MNHLTQDTCGRDFYWVQYSPGCLSELPWGDAVFDCGLFIHPSAQDAEVEACVLEVVEKNTDCVVTFGERAEYWHDRVDNVSVEQGRQEHVGDGNPMTAWFEEVSRADDMDPSCCYLGASLFLFIFVGFEEVEDQVQVLRDKLAKW